jgi:hypothetical protein
MTEEMFSETKEKEEIERRKQKGRKGQSRKSGLSHGKYGGESEAAAA